MATFSKVQLSGSTNGRGIKVAATGTPGTVIHTTSSSPLDEIWIWCQNTDSTDRLLTLEFGGVTAPDDNIQITIPQKSGLVLVVPGLTLTNSTTLRAFAATANVLVIFGYVNRIT